MFRQTRPLLPLLLLRVLLNGRLDDLAEVGLVLELDQSGCWRQLLELLDSRLLPHIAAVVQVHLLDHRSGHT